ncbi:armadillo-type protein [Fimicolochytrium jonesii]|uniref:armadillo-type protein n=1 Tax=Fimicolochytrium jonesii TaxID=1396493 RepID=UPI0022FEC6BE|nr:armadillo-type protein [Fimicolochytrium jonesii]KAI8826151.1 armadillo-type protein [Fimicolochytrium jonesii]
MHFSLTRFVILLKRLAKERLKPKPISDGRTLNAADGDSSTSHSATSKHSFLDFLETPYISLDRPPMKNTPAFNALFKTLAQALCDTSPDRTLRFEAFRLLIQIDNEPQLGRWEVIAFRRVIDEMLQHGNASEQWLAATTLARQGELNDIVLSILRKSLGDVDAARRALALQMLGGLDVSLADRVLQIVLEDCGSTSWRVRCDAVTLLEVWVQKLSELLPCPTDDDDLQTTLHGGGSQSSERSSVASRSTRPSTQQHPPSESEDSANARQLLQMSVQMLLSLMWNDWHQDVRQVASSALARLGKGRTVLDWLVAMLGAEDPLRRVDALRACMRLGFLLAAAVDSYVMCLADNFASVRLEACKLACVVQMKDRSVLNSLLDRVTDFEWQVRAYAVKGVANSGNTDPQVHAALRCVLYHDPNPSVRAEAINATQSLGILAQDKVLQQAVFTLREVDPTPAVRKEADKALTAAVGLIIATGPGQDLPTFTLTNEAGAVVAPSATTNNANAAGGSAGLGSPMPTARGSGNSSVPTTSGRGAASNASNATLSIPFAHILSDRSPAEASVFLRTSLVEEKELEAVIDQVRDMAGQDRVTAEVMESNSGPHPYDEDEEVVDDHVPDVKAIHERKGRRHIDIGLPEIVRKLPGVPMKRPWQNRHRTVAGAAE